MGDGDPTEMGAVRLASFLEQACDGIHKHREKQKGFYVDVTDDAILSSPFDIGEADANRWLNHAEVAVSMMSGMMRAGDNDELKMTRPLPPSRWEDETQSFRLLNFP